MSIFTNYNELIEPDTQDIGRKIVLDVLEAGINSVLPENAMEDMFGQIKGELPQNVTVFGWGKASIGMFKAFRENYNGEIFHGHIISLEDGVIPEKESNLEITYGAHPIPDEFSLKSGEKLLEIARTLDENDTLVCLISGGGSSMFEVPKDKIEMESLKVANELLLKSGADIHEVNSVRRAISKSKGGGLAKAAYPANIINIVISDVPGNNLEDIASGPTVRDPFIIRPLDVVKKYKMEEILENSILELIANYKPLSDQYFKNVNTRIIADNKKAQAAMCKKSDDMGINATKIDGYLTGEAREAVNSFMSAHGDLIVGGGETTVTVKGKGQGGRNQEFVLAGLKNVGNGVLASVGTDGIDGFTDAAGSIGDKDVIDTANKKGYEIESFLDNNDSFEFFKECGGRILTGATGTNVADICVFLKEFK
jgi:glycerate-2-kinase